MRLYACPVCAHMPVEHGPDGCSGTAAYAGDAHPRRQPCGCRAMVNGELVRDPLISSPQFPKEVVSQPMGIMDQINAEVGPPPTQMDGKIAGSEVKNLLWVNKVPFEITSPPQQRQKPPQFMVARPDGSMPSTHQWWVPVRLLQPRGDGTFGYVLQDDGEGGQGTVDHILTFDAGSDYRNGQMQALGRYVQAHGAAGPLMLTKGDVKGRGVAPWVMDDWKGTSLPQASSAPAPVIADDYQYQTRESDGKRFRWKQGMASWEEVPEAPLPPPLPAGPPPLPTPPAGSVVTHAQPIPATRIIQGLATSEGMSSEPVRVEQVIEPVRQAVYAGDGVVRQPSGVSTANAIGTDAEEAAKRGSQTAVSPPPAVGVESSVPAPLGAPQPLQGGGMQTAMRQAYDNKTTILVRAHCDACGVEVNSPAWYNRTNDTWMQSHPCSKTQKQRALNVTKEVRIVAGVS